MIDSDFSDNPDCLASKNLEERIQHIMKGGCALCEKVMPGCRCGHRFIVHDEENRPHRFDGSICIIGCRCHHYTALTPSGEV